MNKRKNVLARVGNFEITRDGAEHEYVRIKTIDGHWGVSLRDDSRMFGVWLMLCRDEEMRRSVEVLLTMYYHLTNMAVDKEFADDFFAAFGRKMERDAAAAPVPTEEESDTAAQEAAVIEMSQRQIE